MKALADFDVASLGDIKTAFDINEVPMQDRFALLSSPYHTRLANTPVLNSFFAAMQKPEIHSDFEVLLETGRVSSRKPNITNPPRAGGIRECFIPRPGYVLIDADYNIIELRTFSQVCLWSVGHSKLAEALNKNYDPHLSLGAQVLGITYEEAIARKKDKDVKDARQNSKPGNFGVPGGMGAAKFRKYAKDSYNVEFTEEEAFNLREVWFEAWPEARDYFNWVTDRSKNEWYYDAEFGDESCRLKQFVSNRYRGGCGYSESCNGYFQALASDIFKAAGFLVARACYDESRESSLFGCRIVNGIHDQFLVEAPEEIAYKAAPEVGRLMCQAAEPFVPDVPATCDPCLANCWSKGAEAVYDDQKRLMIWEPIFATIDEVARKGDAFSQKIIKETKDRHSAWTSGPPPRFSQVARATTAVLPPAYTLRSVGKRDHMGGQNQVKALGAKGRRDVLMFDPDDLTIVEDDEKSIVYDGRPQTVAESTVLDIMHHGILQPINIRRAGEKKGKVILEVISGRKRVRACRIANKRLTESGREPIFMPCMIKQGDDAEIYGMMISENEHREASTPLVRARQAIRLLGMGRTEDQVAVTMKCSKQTVGNSFVKKKVDADEMSVQAAMTLSKLSHEEQDAKAAEMIASGQAKGAAGKEAATRAAAGGKPESDRVRVPSKKFLQKWYDELSGLEKPQAQAGAAVLAYVMGKSRSLVDIPVLADSAKTVADSLVKKPRTPKTPKPPKAPKPAKVIKVKATKTPKAKKTKSRIKVVE